MQFTKFDGQNVKGMVWADKDGIIKMYRSRLQAKKATQKINVPCKVIQNGVWAKTGKPKGFVIVKENDQH